MATRIHTLKLHLKEAVVKAINDTGTSSARISLKDLAFNADGTIADTSTKVGLGLPSRKETQVGKKEVYLLRIDFSTGSNTSKINLYRRPVADTDDNKTNDKLIYTVPGGFHDTMWFDFAPEDEYSDEDIIIEMTNEAVCILTLRKSQGYRQSERLAEFGRQGEINAGA